MVGTLANGSSTTATALFYSGRGLLKTSIGVAVSSDISEEAGHLDWL